MPAMRELIAIVEDDRASTLFHASRRALTAGTILKPGSISEFDEREAWLEEHRPTHCIPRSASVFMTAQADEAKIWGKYVYEVRPMGDVERNDISWFEALVDLAYRDEWDDDERYPEGYDPWNSACVMPPGPIGPGPLTMAGGNTAPAVPKSSGRPDESQRQSWSSEPLPQGETGATPKKTEKGE